MKNCAYMLVFSHCLEWPTGHITSSLKKSDTCWNLELPNERRLPWVPLSVRVRVRSMFESLLDLTSSHPQLSRCREQLTDTTCYLLWGCQSPDRPSESRPDFKLKAQYNLLLFTYSTFRSLRQVTFKNIKKEMSTGKEYLGRGAGHTEMHRDVQYLGVCLKTYQQILDLHTFRD